MSGRILVLAAWAVLACVPVVAQSKDEKRPDDKADRYPDPPKGFDPGPIDPGPFQLSAPGFEVVHLEAEVPLSRVVGRHRIRQKVELDLERPALEPDQLLRRRAQDVDVGHADLRRDP